MLYVDFYPSTSIHPVQSSIYLEVLPTGDDSKTEGDLQSQWVHKADPLENEMRNVTCDIMWGCDFLRTSRNWEIAEGETIGYLDEMKRWHLHSVRCANLV